MRYRATRPLPEFDYREWGPRPTSGQDDVMPQVMLTSIDLSESVICYGDIPHTGTRLFSSSKRAIGRKWANANQRFRGASANLVRARPLRRRASTRPTVRRRPGLVAHSVERPNVPWAPLGQQDTWGSSRHDMARGHPSVGLGMRCAYTRSANPCHALLGLNERWPLPGGLYHRGMSAPDREAVSNAHFPLHRTEASQCDQSRCSQR